MKLILTRIKSDVRGTIGYITQDDNLICYTLELPWKNNEPKVSCIPTGSYECVFWNSPKFGNTYEVMNVPNRSKILLHSGNTVNDIEGCILLGMSQSTDDKEFMVMNSKSAFSRFKLIVENEIMFNLEIKFV